MLNITSMRVFIQLTIAFLLLFTASAQGAIFQIDTLTDANFLIVDHNSVTGDDDGGIAVSDTHVFYDGDSGTGRFNIADLTGGTNIGERQHAMTSDLATSQVYVLGTDATTKLLENGTGPVTHLLEADGSTGLLSGGSIALSSPITVGSGAGFFAGHERIVIHYAATAYNIDLPSGTVTNIGSVSLDSPNVTEVSRYWGIAEYDGTDVRLVYVSTTGGYQYQNIQRTNVTTGVTTTLANFPLGLSDMGAFTVSIANNRWYFHFEGTSGTFGGTGETLGYADATFTVEEEEVPVPAPAAPIPTMSVWGLGMLIALMGLIGFIRRRKM